LLVSLSDVTPSLFHLLLLLLLYWLLNHLQCFQLRQLSLLQLLNCSRLCSFHCRL
jgi:hypothetical protein